MRNFIVIFMAFSIAVMGQTKLKSGAFANGGQTTKTENQQLKSVLGQGLVGLSQDELLTMQSGFLTTVSPGVTQVAHQSDKPSTFHLGQNYPNPFNPETSISYQIPQKAEVTIKVYNILGKVAGVLVNDELDAGRYTVTWQPPELASGVYFYQMQADDYIQTRKMLLVR